MKVYLDSAASTQIHPEVLEEIVLYLKEGIGNPSSTHSYGRSGKAAIESARKTIANGLGVSPLEIIFTSCGTEANNMALKSGAAHFKVKHIISSPLEHKCVKESLKGITSDLQVKLHYLNVDSKGNIDLVHLKQLLSELEGKKLVTIMHANNEIGTMADLQKIGDLCDTYDALFHTDTVQTIGHYNINLSKLNVHFCSGSAHKFHGPKGVGFLYVRSDKKIPAFINGGGQERGYRSGTENIAGIVGMAKAFEIALKDLENDNNYINQLKAYAIEAFQRNIPSVHFNGDMENSLNRVLSVSLPAEFKSDTFLFQLDLAGVAVSGGSACSSGASTGSYVLDAIGHDIERQSIRVSFSIFNTKDEIDFAVAQILTISQKAII